MASKLAHNTRESVADSTAEQKELHRRQVGQTQGQRTPSYWKRFRFSFMALATLAVIVVIVLPLM